MFPELTEDIPSIPSKTKLRGAAAVIGTVEYEPFSFSDLSLASSSAAKPKPFQYDNNYTQFVDGNTSSQLNDVTGMSTSQEPSRNFFNLNRTSHDSSQHTQGLAQCESNQPVVNESYIRNITLAPKVTPPTALQFIRFAYHNQSDNDSDDDDNEIQSETIKPSTRKEEMVKTDERKKSKRSGASCTDSATAAEKQKLLEESFNVSTPNIENVEDIILPVPPQFL